MSLRSIAFVFFAVAGLTILTICGVVTPLFAAIAVALGQVPSEGSFGDPNTLSMLWSAMTVTFSQAFLSATSCVLLALLVGRLHYFLPSRLGSIALNLAQIPFGLPSIILVFGFILGFGNQGWLNRALGPVLDGDVFKQGYIPFLYNFSAIVHAHVFFNFGMCARQVLIRYQSIPKEHWWSAESLNFSRGMRFWVVEIPQLKATLINLWLVVFGLSVTSFAIVLVLGGTPALSTLEVLVYQFLKYDFDYKGAFFAASLQFALVFIVTILSQRFSRGGAETRLGGIPSRAVSVMLPAMGASFRHRLLARFWFVGLAVIFIWIAIPLVSLAAEGIRALHPRNFEFVSDIVFPSFWTSMTFAVPAALLSTCYGLAAAQTILRWRGGKPRQVGGRRARPPMPTNSVANVVSISLLALSPTVLGFSLHASLVAMGMRPFDYTLFGVVVIQSFLFTPLSFRIFYAALQERVHDWRAQYAALNLPLGIQTSVVEWKALWPHITAVFMINLSFSVGEVVGPALFGDATFRPLSLLLLELVGSYQFERAAIVTLFILIIAGTAYATGNRELQNARG